MAANIKEHVYRTFLGGGFGLLFILVLLNSSTPFMGIILSLLTAVVFCVAFYETLSFFLFPTSLIYKLIALPLIAIPVCYSSSLLADTSSNCVLLFTVIAILIFSFSFVFAYPRYTLTHISGFYFGLMYLYIPLYYALSIMFFEGVKIEGRLFFLEVLLVAKATDIGAFYVGKTIGKSPLALQLSPKKTWEGLFGGLVFSQIVYWLFLYVTPQIEFFSKLTNSFGVGAIIALCISLIAVFSDLFESMIKRLAQIKDSGVIPGVGGALDAIDSLLFVIPFAYAIMQLIG